MSASPMSIETITWQGRQVEAKDDSYIFRLDPTNKATAASLTDYRFSNPTGSMPVGWTAKSLGYGFYSLTAPGTTFATVQSWATRNSVASIEPNFIVAGSKAGGTSLERAVGATTVRTNSTTPGIGGAAKLSAIDPDLPSQWALNTIDAPAAWAKTRGSSNVIVAVMSTGIQADHPDLAANMWTRPANVPATLTGINGYDFVNGDDIPEDSSGTGTSMAGVIGAVGGNDTGAQGISGVSPTVRLFAAKVLEASNGNDAQAAIDTTIEAMLRIVQLKTEYYQPFEVVCAANSQVRPSSNVEREAIRTLGSAGILYVVNAGDANNNPNSNAEGLDLDTVSSFPSNYSRDTSVTNILTVAATLPSDDIRLESRRGAATVQIAAPGDAIFTTLPGGAYGSRNGTALAAAHVAGVAALAKAYKADARMADIKQAILDGAERITALDPFVQGGRRLNADGALARLIVTPPTPGGAVPTVSVSNVSVAEGHAGYSNVSVTFRLNQPAAANRPVLVSYATANASAFAAIDYVSQSGTVGFTGSVMEKTVSFRVIGNARPDPDRSFLVVVSQAGSRNVLVPGGTAATVTILDDDLTSPSLPTNGNTLLPRASVAPKYATGAARFAEGSDAVFEVTLDRASSSTVTVKYRTADIRTQANLFATPGLDYWSSSGTLTFKPGELKKTIAVKTLVDTVDDENEKIDIVLFEPRNAILGSAAPAILGAPSPTPPPGASGFTITVKFTDTSLTSSQQSVFQQAAARWSEIITGDLPDVNDNGTVIDDVLIEASAPAIDGAGGVLGQAGPTAWRSGPKGLPYKGVMQFDSADVARMESSGTFRSVILHEMAHVLGVGTAWQPFNLLTGAGTANPLFIGANAVREYNAVFGTTASGVPVENTGGSGTRDGHWRESVFRTELMTGYAERPGTPMPISRITVGQFQDLGYTVDYAKADLYTKPAITAAAAPPQVGTFALIGTAPGSTQPLRPATAAAGKPVVPAVGAAQVNQIALVGIAAAEVAGKGTSNRVAVASASPARPAVKAGVFAALGAGMVS